MFKSKPAYTIEELNSYVNRLETLDRLAEKAKRNWMGTPGGDEQDRAKAIYDSYITSLLVANQTYQAMLKKAGK